MADAAVQFLLENLTQLLIHHAHLIRDVRSQVVQLVENVKFFKSFLKKVSRKKRRNDEMLRVLVGEIRGVVYDADDIIDAFVTQAAENKTRSYFSRGVSTAADLIPIANKVGKICDDINKIYGGKDKLDFINLVIDDGEDDEPLQVTFSLSLSSAPYLIWYNYKSNC